MAAHAGRHPVDLAQEFPLIITNSRQKPVASAEFEEKQFSIRLNPKLFEALGSLYTDPILALCREYMTNADEAHQLAGHNQPIEVTLPTKLKPDFVVQDRGPGLPKEKLFELFTTYGASGDEKETSNDYEGGFGLGGKCWRAYADSIVVESCHNGTRTTYSFFLDETNMGKAAILASEPCRDTGITIRIPVKKEDMDTFANRAANIAWMFPVRPRFTNLSASELADKVDDKIKFAERKTIYDGGRYTFFGDSGDSFVRMGRLLYPVSTQYLPSNFNKLLAKLVEAGVLLTLKVGEVDLAPSRETLKYTTRTVACLLSELKAIADNLAENLIRMVDQAHTEYEAILKVNQLSARGFNNHYHNRNDANEFNRLIAQKLDGKWTWQGKPLLTKEYSLKHIFKDTYTDSLGDFKDWIRTKGINARVFWIHPYRTKLQTEFETDIIPHNKAAFFLTERAGFPTKRIRKFLEENKEKFDHLYAIGVQNKSRTLIESKYPNFFSLPFLSVEDMPELSAEEAKDDNANGTKSRKHCSGHYFLYKDAGNVDKLSDHWHIVDDPDISGNEVFVYLDKFQPMGEDKTSQICYIDQALHLLRYLGNNQNKKIYGIKLADAAGVPKHWVCLDIAVKNALRDKLSDPLFRLELTKVINEHAVAGNCSHAFEFPKTENVKDWTKSKYVYYHKLMDKLLFTFDDENITAEVLNKLHPDLAKVFMSKLESREIIKNNPLCSLLIEQGLLGESGLNQWTSLRNIHFKFFDLIREFAAKYPMTRYYHDSGEYQWDEKKRKLKADIFNQYVTGWSRLNNPQKETQV
jgi:hypothetical protein